MKGSMWMGRRKGKGLIIEVMVLFILVNGRKIKFLVRVSIYDLIKGNMMDNERIIACMDRVFIYGLMEENIKG